MNFCPENFLNNPKNHDLIDFLEKSSLKEIILFLNRLKTKSTDAYKDVAVKSLGKIRDLIPLQYKQITMLLLEEYSTDDKIENVTLNWDVSGINGLMNFIFKSCNCSTENKHKSSSLD